MVQQVENSALYSSAEFYCKRLISLTLNCLYLALKLPATKPASHSTTQSAAC